MTDSIADKVFSVDGSGFAGLAFEIAARQRVSNPVYAEWCLQVSGKSIVPNNGPDEEGLIGIPFLPIRFFKTHEIKSGVFEPETVFESSGTTGSQNSRHPIKDLSVYRKSFFEGFRRVYGHGKDWCVLGLLPSYLEKGNSSLVFMVDGLIKQGAHPLSGFYLNDFERLAGTLTKLEAEGQKTLLVGVTYALLDFAAAFPMPLRSTTVMETGGMKGRGKELTRAEVHQRLCSAFSLGVVHSEYGMTELLGQAYAASNGIFRLPPWMRAFARDENDPFAVRPQGRGGLNIMDLSNLYSCSFIATEDVVDIRSDGSFEVLGRMGNSDLRGCSLMYY